MPRPTLASSILTTIRKSSAIACIVYLPLARLRISPHADLVSPNLYTDTDPIFVRVYCANLGMSRQIPLKVVADIGGGGTLARIQKGRKLMRERKSEWSQADELPVRLSLAVPALPVC